MKLNPDKSRDQFKELFKSQTAHVSVYADHIEFVTAVDKPQPMIYLFRDIVYALEMFYAIQERIKSEAKSFEKAFHENVREPLTNNNFGKHEPVEG